MIAGAAIREDALISVRDLWKSFGDRVVLRGVSLDIPEGQTTAIMGPSGTGKSVLLKHVVGLLSPDRGSVKCFGQEIVGMDEAGLYAVRRRMGMLFQHGALFDSLSVGDNVGFPLVHHARELPAAERRARVDAVLAQMGLPDAADRAVSELSGGQRKRVALARAIVMKPEIVLFDEPNSGLDPITADSIDALICQMKNTLGITFVVITHDVVGAVNVADRMVVLGEGGVVVASGTTAEVLRSTHPMVQRFFARNLQPPA